MVFIVERLFGLRTNTNLEEGVRQIEKDVEGKK